MVYSLRGGILTSYNGTLTNGSRLTGKGTLKMSNGDMYTGEMVNMQAEGNGLFKYADGWTYYGELSQNKRHGIGIYEKMNQALYSGQFQNDLMHGYGNFTSPERNTYQCQWKQGQRQGHCTTYFENGDIEIGLWSNDLKEGTHFGSLKKYKKFLARYYEKGKQIGKNELMSPTVP
ncbi:hypothetical protein FGO68_gene2876 [Halteria grandinella]|uniref:MORN repeat-containing protein n=1 Tax=Halteria grandinella TaxID=5974 RepID=A0A8J8NBS1_HALGN|nr:hypothetical protein FGO68_gene2876 [Halteria grandinella]